MSQFPNFVILSLASLLVGCGGPEPSEFSHIKTPYLGQTPPGSTPIAFAPGLVTTAHYEYGGAFSPDMTEFYFIAGGGEYDGQKMISYAYKEGQWEQSAIVPRAGQPFISPDGKIMHLGRLYKERTETGWSERKTLSAPFSEIPIMRMTASERGTYYFDTFDRDNLGFPIRYSRLIGGKYEMPKPLGPEINTGSFLNHPFIAQDESYLIFDAKREGGQGDSDIYISFRQQDGSWGEAKNLGAAVNTDAWEASASVTPDGKYLFFSRNIGSKDYENVDIFWVDAKVIEDLRSK